MPWQRATTDSVTATTSPSRAVMLFSLSAFRTVLTVMSTTLSPSRKMGARTPRTTVPKVLLIAEALLI